MKYIINVLKMMIYVLKNNIDKQKTHKILVPSMEMSVIKL